MPNTPNMVDFLNPRIFQGLVEETPIPADYAAMDRFLPEREVAGDKLLWDILVSEQPMAPFVAPSAESPTMGGEVLKQAYADIAYIRMKRRLDEADVRILRDIGQAPSLAPGLNAMRTAAQGNITRQAARLKQAVAARLAWLRVQALLGSVTYDRELGSNVKFTVTYPVITKTASPAWTDTTNADPVRDMMTWFLDYPWRFGTLIISKAALFNIAQNAKVRRALFQYAPSGSEPSIVTQAAVERYLSGELGLDVIAYDAQVTSRADAGGSGITITPARILPATKAIFLPAGEQVGYMATAPAPQNDYKPGFFSWQDESGVTLPRDPWLFEVGAGYYGFPVLERPGMVMVATIG